MFERKYILLWTVGCLPPLDDIRNNFVVTKNIWVLGNRLDGGDTWGAKVERSHPMSLAFNQHSVLGNRQLGLQGSPADLGAMPAGLRQLHEWYRLTALGGPVPLCFLPAL